MSSRKSRAMAALVLALPLRGVGQAPVLSSDVAPVSKPAQQNAGTAPRQYLNEAARVMMTIPERSTKGEAQKKLAELRKHFAELISAYDKNPDPFVYPAVPGDEDLKIDNKSEPPNWKKSFTGVENVLVNILGAVAQAGSTPAPSGATGTTGTTTGAPQAPQAGSVNAGLLAGAVGVKNLDPEVRRQLEQFRLDVELFFAAMTMNLESEATR